MDNTQKMLRVIINGQSSMKSELLDKISKVDKKVDSFRNETRKGFKHVNNRIDKLGKSLAYLEDDAPTRDEFDGLEKRVSKVEHKIAAV